jgi:hypothetical protein
MVNAGTVSEAGRMLSRKRWGDTRLKSLIAELEQRRAELGADHLRELQELVDERSDDRG